MRSPQRCGFAEARPIRLPSPRFHRATSLRSRSAPSRAAPRYALIAASPPLPPAVPIRSDPIRSDPIRSHPIPSHHTKSPLPLAPLQVGQPCRDLSLLGVPPDSWEITSVGLASSCLREVELRQEAVTKQPNAGPFLEYILGFATYLEQGYE
jgi:hypothetical protein